MIIHAIHKEGPHMKKIRTLLSMLLVLCLTVTSVLVFSAADVSADAGYIDMKYAKKITVSTESPYIRLVMKSKLKGAKSVKVTSSNKSVVKTYKYKKSGGGIFIELKKPGTSKLTIKCKKNGKTKKYKCKVKVVKYKNPVKSLKIAGLEIGKKFNKKAVYSGDMGDERTGVIKVVPAKGWKVKKIVETTFKSNSSKFVEKTIVNNKTKISLEYNKDYTVVMYNKSRNQTETLYIYN